MDPSDEEFLNKFASLPINDDSSRQAMQLSSSMDEITNYSKCLLIKVVSRKAANHQELHVQLMRSWKPKGPVSFSPAGNNLFVYQFVSEGDINYVLQGGPWTYKFDPVVVKRISGPHEVNDQFITHVELNIQMHSKFPDLISAQAVLQIAREMGYPVSSPQTVVTSESKFHKVRVAVPIDRHIMSKKEYRKERGSSKVKLKDKAFASMVQRAGLQDLGYSGPAYTWSNGQPDTSLICQRIDRAMASATWVARFPHAKVKYLPRMNSDHAPILLSTSSGAARGKMFRVENWWLMRQDFNEVCNRVLETGAEN
ncbi:hypothetical protein LUZ63_014926 [Rhynchospora breviuscula]|uniref:DUF4283 domain-containing protein n=1 Tax=Rhynchospora breviuscula TaxID=2022672 RepID=A0A9Q0CBD7_9POAL|nr:hypothetical protein LUZ63_014926 [Rhynchospora breviuscula]